MPPKPKAQAQKVVQDDLAEAANLPPITPFIFTNLYQQFQLKSRRQGIVSSLQSHITSHAAQQPFRITNREEIMTSGKNRGIFNDKEGAEIPEESLTVQHYAKAAYSKILELSMPFMKARRDKIAKLQEEAKAAAEEENKKKAQEANGAQVQQVLPKPVVLEDNQPDVFIMLQGFPSSKEEAHALAKQGYAVNGVIIVTDQTDQGFGNKSKVSSPQQDESISQEDIISPEENLEVFKKLRMFEKAKAESDKSSPLRAMAVKRVDYLHEVNEEANKDSVAEFPGTVFQPNIQKLGGKLMTFKKFKAKAKMISLTRQEDDEKILEQQQQVPKASDAPEGAAPPEQPPAQAAPAQEKEESPSSIKQQEETTNKTEVFKRNLAAIPNGTSEDVNLVLNSLVEQIAFDIDRSAIRQGEFSAGQTVIQGGVGQSLASEKKLSLQNQIASSGDIMNEPNQELDPFFKEFLHNIELQCNLTDGVFQPNHMQFEQLSEQGEDIYSKRHDLGAMFSAVLDEADLPRSKNLSSRLLSGDFLDDRQQQIFDAIQLPGVGRNLMPQYPEKSQELRNAEKTELYPFASLSHDMLERVLILKNFEEMMKNKENERDWLFTNRFYQEHFNETTLKSTLLKSMLMDPDMVNSYRSRDDSLLLAMYNKTPPGRILRKRWTAPYLGMPDFENWLNHFQRGSSAANANLFDIDDTKVGQIQERIKYLYPSDDSMIRVSNVNIANRKMPSILVEKDNLFFGIRQGKSNWKEGDNQKTEVKNEEEQNKQEESKQEMQQNQNDPSGESKPAAGDQLVQPKDQQVPQSNALNLPRLSPGEAWFSFDNDYRMMVQMVHHISTAPSPLLGSDLSPPRCSGAATTITTSDGLIIKYLPNGDVLQHRPTSLSQTVNEPNIQGVIRQKEEAPRQESRLICGLGSVVRYLSNHNIQILHPNGNTALFRKQANSWLITNNKGKRRIRNCETGKEEDTQAIPCAHKTDPESLAKVMIRQDNVISIHYADTSILTIHADGTWMYTDNTGTIIEQLGYVPVKVRLDKVKQRSQTVIGMGGTDALMGSDDIMERSHDGRVVVTYLFDKSEVRMYRERQELEGFKFSDNYVVLVKRPDAGVIKVKQDGEVIVVSANQRQALNKRGKDIKYGLDSDYMFDLYGISSERNEGIYTLEVGKGLLWTKDGEGNIFRVLADGSTHERLAVSFDLKAVADDAAPNQVVGKGGQKIQRPESPALKQDGQFIEQECRFLPPPKTLKQPRLIIIRKDGTGQEFLSKSQLAHYFRTQAMDKNVMRQGDETLIASGTAYCRAFLTLVKNREELWKECSQLTDLQIPRTVDSVPQTVAIPKQASKRFFLFRNILEHIPFDDQKQDLFNSDMERYLEWKEAVNKQQSEFCGINAKLQNADEMQKMDIEDDRNLQRRIMLKVIRQRRKQEPFYPPEQVKERLINEQIIVSNQGHIEFKAIGSSRRSSACMSDVGSQFYRERTDAQSIASKGALQTAGDQIMSPKSGTHGKSQSTFSQDPFSSKQKPHLPPTGIGRNLPPKTGEQLRAVGDNTILNPTDTPRQRAIQQEAMRLFHKQASQKQLEKKQLEGTGEDFMKKKQFEGSGEDFMKKQDSLETESFSNVDHLGVTEENFDIQHEENKNELYTEEELELMQQRNPFVANYFSTRAGQKYLKANPQAPPTQQMIERQSNRNTTGRSIGGMNQVSGSHSLHPASQRQRSEAGSSAANNPTGGNFFDKDMQPVVPKTMPAQIEDHDNPIVELQPQSGGGVNQASGQPSGRQQGSTIIAAGGGNLTNTKMSKQTLQRRLRPSVTTQQQVAQRHYEQHKIIQAENYHMVKGKQFDVYGGTRTKIQQPNSIKKSNIRTQINEKYIITQAIMDRRMKTSSMAAHTHFRAPNVQQVRKQGQHQMILGALAKKQTFVEMIDQASLMVSAAIADPLKRTFASRPAAANFGPVCQGKRYRLQMSLKNEDSIAQRLNVTPPIKGSASRYVKIWNIKKGPIAPGLNETVIIELTAPLLTQSGKLPESRKASRGTQENEQVKSKIDQMSSGGGGILKQEVKRTQKIDDEFKIVTKTDNLIIPIIATILPQGQYEDLKLINPESIKCHPVNENLIKTQRSTQSFIKTQDRTASKTPQEEKDEN